MVSRTQMTMTSLRQQLHSLSSWNNVSVRCVVLDVKLLGPITTDDCRVFDLQDLRSDERFHVELHFSPGVYGVGQTKEYLAGRGYRPQHGEKKQVHTIITAVQ